jgi:hypothetical protein
MWVEGTLAADEIAIVDSATLMAVDGTATHSRTLMPQARRERVRQVIDAVRARRRFGRPDPWEAPSLGAL